MSGQIYFDTVEQLAEFLKAFTGSTAIFKVKYLDNCWVMEFQGGF